MRALALLVVAATAFAQPRLPLEFDADPGWAPKPSYLPNPAAAPSISAADGAVTLGVSEPGKGMKFELALKPFDSGAACYLVLRYRAQGLAGGYAVWVYDGTGGGCEALNAGELMRDGEWHVIALDLTARGAKGLVRSLLTEVQCQEAPAWISFDFLRLSDEAPEGAAVIPAPMPDEPELLLRAADLRDLTPQPKWLAPVAPTYGAEVRDGLLHLFADGSDQGMKFSAVLPEAIDLSRFHYVAIRYRSHNTAPWGDYLLWLGSAGGGAPQQSTHLISLSQAQPTGSWQVAVLPITKGEFTATDAAVAVSSLGGRGEVWLDTVRFCVNKPLIELGDILPIREGWGASLLTAGAFAPVDFAPLANAGIKGRLRALGLKSWLPAGDLTVRGVPFRTLGGAQNVVAAPQGIAEMLAIPVGLKGTELYVLMSSRLPALDSERGAVPMDRTDRPERVLFRVEYEDGVTDEVFPVCLGSGQYEVHNGPDVYCLTGLRPQVVKSVSLRNRMDSASFIVAAATMNRGEPVTKEPSLLTLPPQVAARADAPERGAITGLGDGFAIENGLMRLDLQTAGGLVVRSIENRCLTGERLEITPGALFEIGMRDAEGKQVLLRSDQVTVGEGKVTTDGERSLLTVPVDGSAQGVPVKGELVVAAGGGPDILMNLNLTYTGEKPGTPIVSFPLVNGMKIGSNEETWYLWTRKGGVVSNQPTDMWEDYGGGHPLQVADVFSPTAGGGLALLTYDLADIARYWHLNKTDGGTTWRMDYLPREHQPGERIEVAPTALRAHSGDWREALRIYGDWVRTWYKPQVARKPWFQQVFYYQQVFAWAQLHDAQSPNAEWPMRELVQQYKDYFGRLDYLHIFDYGESRAFGRVGDYDHYEELGGLDVMRRGVKTAQDMGVPVGLYLEGYLCDIRCAWGKGKVLRNCIRNQDGTPMLWDVGSTEYVMCAASQEWREYLAGRYAKAAADLKPDGLYIDEYGFIAGWRTCWSSEHGHPVPCHPIRGERDTTAAIRAAMPPEVATLTEETPNDVNTQYADGGLCYSVSNADPASAPHRVNLIRFAIPDFKTFQLTSYNRFDEGGWQLLKYPFFNGEGFWLHGDTSTFYCEDAHQFLKGAFRVLHDYADCFASEDVEPLVPTLSPVVFANRFGGGERTVWTVLNAGFRTFRGEVLRVTHKTGARYRDAFTGEELAAHVEAGAATISLELGPKGVGCVAQVGP